MKNTPRTAAFALAIAAAGAVAGTAVAQTDSGGAPEPAATELLVAERGDPFAVGSDAVVAAQPSSWVPIAPYRAWDSRNNEGFRLFTVDGGGQALALNVLFDEEDQLRIPQSATGVTFNVTVVDHLGTGFLTVAEVNQPTDEAKQTSTVNWVGEGPPVANGSSVALGSVDDVAGYVKILVGGTASGTEYIVDITGYYTAVTPG